MANINTNKNAVELRKEMLRNGTVVEYIIIDGQKCGIMGSVSEEDRDAAIKTLQDAYVASNGNIMTMMKNFATIATIEEKGIDPTEVVEICGVEIMIDYSEAKAYTMNGKEIANCEDLPDMPNRAVKAVLMARAETTLN
jgi:hypothetical protein